MAVANFSIVDEFNNLKKTHDYDFKKHNTQFTLNLDPSIP